MRLLVFLLAAIAPRGIYGDCRDPIAWESSGQNVGIAVGDILVDPATCTEYTCAEDDTLTKSYGCKFPAGYDSEGRVCSVEGEIIELTCESQKCMYRSDVDHGVFDVDPSNVPRCSIGGQCYTVNSGPDSCTKCVTDELGDTWVNAGCIARDGSCVPEGSDVIENCVTKICEKKDNSLHFSPRETVGCFSSERVDGRLQARCYGEGEKLGQIQQCKTCTVYQDEHHWDNICRTSFPWEGEKCYPPYHILTYQCQEYNCSNYGAIGWSRVDTNTGDCWYRENPVDVQKKCLADGEEKMMSDFCYYCDGEGGKAKLACLICGQCVRPGASVECEGATQTCQEDGTTAPQEAKTICKIGDVTLQEGQATRIQCTRYRCTSEGPTIIESDCQYKGMCWPVGHNCSVSCLYCVPGADGRAVLKQKCSFGGQCLSEGEVDRDHNSCKLKKCVHGPTGMTMVPLENQQPHCKFGGCCVPEGPIQTPLPGLCVRCDGLGILRFSCKLSDGSCLGINKVDTSLGCYDLECHYDNATNKIGLRKLPGQPLVCTLPDGSCLPENQERTVGDKKYICLNKDVCVVNNKPVPLGETVVSRCHTYLCTEVEENGVKIKKAVIQDYKCPDLNGGDGCHVLGSDVTSNCYNYKCERKDGEKFARLVNTTDSLMCSHNGQCIKWGQNIDTPAGTVRCGPGPPGRPGNQGGCKINGKHYGFGETAHTTCNAINCWREGGRAGVRYMDPKCSLKVNGKHECVPAGQHHSEFCYKCVFDEFQNAPQHILECQTDDKQCVPNGGNGTFQCVPCRCQSGRWVPLEQKTACHWSDGACFDEGAQHELTYSGRKLRCECMSAATNQVGNCRPAK